MGASGGDIGTAARNCLKCNVAAEELDDHDMGPAHPIGEYK
jgi:hypothetical protein